MPYKICTSCGKASYSAAASPQIQWLCPYCDEDLTEVTGLTSLPKENENCESK